MDLLKIEMDGLVYTPQRRIATEGGDVFHAMKAGDPGYAGFGEAYFSTVVPGAIKAWKRHSRMTLNLVVISGAVRFVVYDDREGSATHGKTCIVEMGPDLAYGRLTVAPGLWMGFACKGSRDAILINIASMAHDPAEADRKPLDAIAFDWSKT